MFPARFQTLAVLFVALGTSGYSLANADRTEEALHALGVPPDSDQSAFLEAVLPPAKERSSAWDWIRRERAEMLKIAPLVPPFVLDLLNRRVGPATPDPAQPAQWIAIGPEHPESDLPALPAYPHDRRVRVALDPGHMGGAEWDALTGKFIRESRRPGAKMLSEGVLALQVALLLEERLQRQGYDVLLTRRGFEPASPLRPADLDLETWSQHALRQKSWGAWFQGLLPQFLSDGVAAFRRDPFYQKLISDDNRMTYFLNGEDLRARAEKIAAFEPDLTVVIHFDISAPKAPDADPHGLNPDAYSAVKVYVPGGFFPDELASSEDRAWYAFHLLHKQRAHAHLTLARELVQSLTLELGLPPDPNDMGNSVLIEPGVFARNLYLTRRNAVSPLAYVETLFYNTPSEFAALYPTPQTQVGHIAGSGYTRRLEKVVSAYEKGIQSWLQSLH